MSICCASRDSEDRYQTGLARLLEAIVLAEGGQVKYRSWDRRLKPWDFAAFLDEKRRDFCGRHWLFDRLDAWRRAGGHERALLITGDPGTGKSAIVAQLVHLNPGGQVLAYHCCQAGTQATLEPWRFVHSLAAMIASKLDGYAAQLEDSAVQEAFRDDYCKAEPASAFDEGILAPLEKLPAPADGVRYLLIDALDEALLHRGPVNLVELLAPRLERLPGWLRVVATTRKEPEVLERLQNLRAQELDAQDPCNLEDLDRFIAQRLASPGLAERLAAGKQSAAAVARTLLEHSAGNFLYVQQALQGIERDTCTFDDLHALPPGLYGLYRGFFETPVPGRSEFWPRPHRSRSRRCCPRALDRETAGGDDGTGPRARPAGSAGAAGCLPAPPPGRQRGAALRRLPQVGGRLADRSPPPRQGTLRPGAARHESLHDFCWREYGAGARGCPLTPGPTCRPTPSAPGAGKAWKPH